MFKIGNHRQSFIITIFVVAAGYGIAHAESESVPQPESVAAVVTDGPQAPTMTPQEVAREVVRIQGELGGSIVSDLGTTDPWPAPSTSHTQQRRSTVPVASHAAVNILRESARQLEQSAHQLESLDLYPEADKLRAMANQLRQQARKIRAEVSSTQNLGVVGKAS